jgi:carbon monoxide dehydrogenase subunit G
MAHYCTTVQSPAPAQDVFSYLADFATIAEWDPGVKSAHLLGGEAGSTGARYLVKVAFLGRTMPLEYVILESVEPTAEFAGRVVLEAITADFRSYDIITVAPRTGGSTVTYDADLALRGIRRPFDPFLRPVFKVIGDRARSGLQSAVQLRSVT